MSNTNKLLAAIGFVIIAAGVAKLVVEKPQKHWYAEKEGSRYMYRTQDGDMVQAVYIGKKNTHWLVELTHKGQTIVLSCTDACDSADATDVSGKRPHSAINLPLAKHSLFWSVMDDARHGRLTQGASSDLPTS